MPSRSAPEPAGRLGAFTLLGAAAGSVPLPWVPTALVRRVRGALVQDLAARHGLALSTEARRRLSEPSGKAKPPGATREAMRFLAVRFIGRMGPARVLPPVRTAVDTFVLGHLFARYLASRPADHGRIDDREARRVRHAIDAAIVHALTGDATPESEALILPIDDVRDPWTQMIDGALIATAGAPEWLVRRLDAAFDDVLARG